MLALGEKTLYKVSAQTIGKTFDDAESDNGSVKFLLQLLIKLRQVSLFVTQLIK